MRRIKAAFLYLSNPTYNRIRDCPMKLLTFPSRRIKAAFLYLFDPTYNRIRDCPIKYFTDIRAESDEHSRIGAGGRIRSFSIICKFPQKSNCF